MKQETPLTLLAVMPLFTGLRCLFDPRVGEPSGMPAAHHFLSGVAASSHKTHLAFIVDRGVRDSLSFRARDFPAGTLAHHLLSRLEGVHLLTYPTASLAERLERLMGRRELALDARQLACLPLKVYGTARQLYSIAATTTMARRLKPDVIYGALNHWLTATAAGKKTGTPTVSRLYGALYYYPGLHWWQKLLHPLEAAHFLLRSDLYVMTNDGTRGQEVLQHFGVPPQRIRFWLNGVQKPTNTETTDRASILQRCGIDPSHKVVLAASRLVNWKRVDRVIRSIPAVRGARRDVQFVVLGDGAERPGLEQLAAALGVSQDVRFLGFTPQAKVYEFMNAADVFVATYDVSNLSNPVLEAMARGACIVSVDDGSLTGVLRSGETGVLLHPSHVDEELPLALTRLLGDEADRQRLGQNARKFALANFRSWEERIGAEIQAIEEVADGAGKQ